VDLTLREALQLSELANAKVLAGKDSLDRVIRYVDMLEVPVSDIRPFLRADELVVTTAYLLRDDTKALLSLVEALAEVNAAGLMIKSARFIGEIPPSVIEKADALRLPIIEVPKEVPILDITHSILKEILGRQSRFLEYSDEVRHALTIVELEGTGLDSLASTVARLVGNEVAITDARLEVLAWSGPGTASRDSDQRPSWLDLLSEKREDLGYLISTTGRIGPDSSIGVACLVRPVIVKGKTLGYLIVREDESPLGEMELIALEHASITVALEMTKQQALAEVQRRLEIDFFDDLLMGNIRSPEVAAQRAQSLGLPARHPVAVVVISIDDADRLGQKGDGEALSQEARDELSETVRLLAFRRNPRPVVVTRSDSVVCLLPLSSASAAGAEGLSFGKEVVADVGRKMPQVALSVGVSHACTEPIHLPSAYKEAMAAIEITRATIGNGASSFIGDLEAYQFLYEYPDRRRLRQMVLAALKPLFDFDGQNNTELVKTLTVLLTRAKSNDDAARKLHVHRNTLTYRLRQIEQILSVDLSNPEHRFRLGMAVRAAPFCSENASERS